MDPFNNPIHLRQKPAVSLSSDTQWQRPIRSAARSSSSAYFIARADLTSSSMLFQSRSTSAKISTG